MRLILSGRASDIDVTLSPTQAQWLRDLILQTTPQTKKATPYPLLHEIQTKNPGQGKEFETFVNSPSWKKLRRAGLLLV